MPGLRNIAHMAANPPHLRQPRLARGTCDLSGIALMVRLLTERSRSRGKGFEVHQFGDFGLAEGTVSHASSTKRAVEFIELRTMM